MQTKEVMAIEPSVRADVRHAVTGWPPDGLDGEPDVDLVLARSEFPLQIASDLLTSRSTGEVA
jgi:hypothetical protein